jgi:uncharacterized membrane protein
MRSPLSRDREEAKMDAWVVIGMVLAGWVAGVIVFVRSASPVVGQALDLARLERRGMREAHE